jgi:hypothetical protein
LTVIPDTFHKLLLSADNASAIDFKEKYNQDTEDGYDYKPVWSRTVLQLLWIFGPFDTVLVIGDNETAFTSADRLQWSDDSITTLIQARFGPRVIGALISINPFTARAGGYTVTVDGCSGELSVKNLTE